MHRRIAVLLALLTAILCLFAGIASAEEGVFELPSSMKTIKAEAFYGADWLTEVKLPSGVQTIGSKAFAYSGLKKIHLPASLTSIADDVFTGCSGIRVTADAGSYAYNWAVRNGYIVETKPLSITATADTKTIITGVTRPSGTFTVSGGVEPYSVVYSWYADGYKYPQQVNEDYTVGISAGTAHWSFEPCNNEDGTFHVDFECTDSAGNKVTYTLSGFKMQAPEPDDAISVSSSSTSSPYTVTVVSSGSWKATSNASWLTLSKTSGSAGTTTVKVTAAANTTGYDRTGKVTFTCGTATDTFTVTQKGVLAAPTGLKGTVLSSTSVRLSWNAVAGAEEYWVGYSTSRDSGFSGFYCDGTSTEIEGLDEANVYYFKVKAIRGTTPSDTSEVLELQLSDPEPDDAISVSSSSTSSPYTVTVVSSGSWKATSNASWLTLSKTSGSAGTTTVKVTAAENTTGSARTGTVTFTCGTATDTFTVLQDVEFVLEAPSMRSAAAQDSQSIYVRWYAVDEADGYYLYRSLSSSGEYVRIATINSGSTLSYTDTMLSPDTKYYYKVQAFAIIDEDRITSDLSSYKSATTDELEIEEAYLEVNHAINGDLLAARSMILTNAEGQSCTWTVSSNSSWTISTSGDTSWFTLSRTSGSGSGVSLKITTKNGYTLSYREANLTFEVYDEYTNGYKYYDVKIYQMADSYDPDADLQLSCYEWNPTYGAKTQSVTVTTSSTYSVSVDAEGTGDKAWLSYTKSGSTLKLKVRENYGISSRTGTVTVTAGGVTRSIIVTQDAGAAAPTLALRIGDTYYSEDQTYGPLKAGDQIYMSADFTDTQRLFIQVFNPANDTTAISTSVFDSAVSGTSVEYYPKLKTDLAPGIYVVRAFASNSDVRDDPWAQKVTVQFNIRVVDPTSHNYTIAGLGTIGYKPGEYFTDDHTKDGNDVWINGAYQCWGFAKYVQYQIYGDGNTKQSRVNYGILPKKKVTSNSSLVVQDADVQEKIKNAIIAAGPGCHVRVYNSRGIDEKINGVGYWGHSFIVTAVNSSGMSIIQANGSYGDDFGYAYNRISTAYWSWDYFFNDTSYGKRGLRFIE